MLLLLSISWTVVFFWSLTILYKTPVESHQSTSFISWFESLESSLRGFYARWWSLPGVLAWPLCQISRLDLGSAKVSAVDDYRELLKFSVSLIGKCHDRKHISRRFALPSIIYSLSRSGRLMLFWCDSCVFSPITACVVLILLSSLIVP